MSDAMITRRGGGGSGKLQSKTVVPAATASIVSPDSGYDGLSSVTVAAITPQKEAQIYTPGTADQIIAADRWLAGQQTIRGDANLLAANIKKGVSIFGIAGAYEAGLDTNSAILKVVTSTGCSTITVTNGTDTFMQQTGQGFVRPNDANVTEYFFVIPSAAFGTFSVTATHPTYGDNTKTSAVVIGDAGQVYEVLCGGVNIILDGTFGLQSGYTINSQIASSLTYSDRYKNINGNFSSAQDFKLFNEDIPVIGYSELTINATVPTGGANAWKFKLIDVGNDVLSVVEGGAGAAESTSSISGAYYPGAALYITGSITTISKIILT